MSKYVTIGELCRITGLTRKIVNDYDKEKIVRASAWRTIGYEDPKGNMHDGYKVYDEEAVVKFKQIAILRKLGWKRADIKKKMEPGVYDEEKLLDEQIILLQNKKEEIENLILAVEQMKMIGIKKGAFNVINSVGMDALAIHSKKWMNSVYFQELSKKVELHWEEYAAELEAVFTDLEAVKNHPIESREVQNWASEYLKLNIKIYGIMGILFLFILPICVEGEGELAKDFEEMLGKETLLIMSQIMSCYTRKWLLDRLDSLIGLLAELEVCSEREYSDEQIIQKVEAIKGFCDTHMGIKTKAEYRFIFDNLSSDIYDGKLQYALEAVKYHCE